MNNEPVYMFRRKGLEDFCTCTYERFLEFQDKPKLFETKVLYTTPKELTDEEIKDLYLSMKALDQSNILIRFSRELLKKAREK